MLSRLRNVKVNNLEKKNIYILQLLHDVGPLNYGRYTIVRKIDTYVNLIFFHTNFHTCRSVQFNANQDSSVGISRSFFFSLFDRTDGHAKKTERNFNLFLV